MNENLVSIQQLSGFQSIIPINLENEMFSNESPRQVNDVMQRYFNKQLIYLVPLCQSGLYIGVLAHDSAIPRIFHPRMRNCQISRKAF